MNAVGFAWRSLVRQPARAALGILGVAAVGALLFDMLLLSEGLIVSMRDVLERTGYDIRITATTELPRSGPRITGVADATKQIDDLPVVASALAIRFASTRIDRSSTPGDSADSSDAGAGDSSNTTTTSRPLARPSLSATIQGVVWTGVPPWTLVRGRDVTTDGEVVIGQSTADVLGVGPGSSILLRTSCEDDAGAPPPVRATVAGIAEFPFELGEEHTIGASLRTLEMACGNNAGDEADMILVRSTGDADATAEAIRAARPDLGVATNEQMLGRLQQGGFTYFRQISSVLTTVTLTFSLLLISVLLTVSVNQRLGEIAALRALGFSRSRVIADVLSESALIVGIGGVLSLPLGGVMAIWLDQILRSMPGIPAQLHFFVFQWSAIWMHVGLLVLTAFAAALYPMRIVARLPIAATLRAEVVG